MLPHQQQRQQAVYYPPTADHGGYTFQQPFPSGSYQPAPAPAQHQQQYQQQYHQQYQQQYSPQPQQYYPPLPQQVPGAVGNQQPGPAPGHSPVPPPQSAVPADRFAHIRHLATFPILGDKEQDALSSVGAVSVQAASLVNPAAHKKKVANHMWNTVSTTTALTTMTFSTAVVTRWAVIIDPATRSTIIVDVWEGRGSKSWMANTIWMVSNANVNIRVRDKWDVKLKAGKMWTKDLNTKPLESVTWLTENGGAPTEIPFEIVERQERPLSQVEIPHIKDRFKVWRVPG